MTDEQKAAYVMAQAACLMAEVAGMQAENQMRLLAGHSPAYDEAAFSSAIGRSGCGHNDVLTMFRG